MSISVVLAAVAVPSCASKAGNEEMFAYRVVGTFASRGPNRPSRLGVSRCQLLHVDGRDLHVASLDALDGTPVLDIKPYLREFAPRGEVVQPNLATDLMRHYD